MSVLPSVVGSCEIFMNKIVYILADNRSGSTLLDQLLGAHDKVISVGEIHHIAAYLRQDRALYDPVHELKCSCGQAVGECAFWSRVADRLDRPVESLRLRPRLLINQRNARGLVGTVKEWPKRLIGRYPRIIKLPGARRLLDLPAIGRDSFALYDAIFDASNARYIVDSSKSPVRFRAVFEAHPGRVVALLLARDYRATVYSKVKRHRSLERSARKWVTVMRQMQELTDDVRTENLLRVRYEDLCENPRSELSRICAKLGLEFKESMLTRPAIDVHHLGGSPSKFDPSRRDITLDTSYLTAFSPDETNKIRRIAGKTGAEWGYM